MPQTNKEGRSSASVAAFIIITRPKRSMQKDEPLVQYQMKRPTAKGRRLAAKGGNAKKRGRGESQSFPIRK